MWIGSCSSQIYLNGGGLNELLNRISNCHVDDRFVTASTEKANAVVYCQYVSYLANCVAGPVVVLRARHVAGAAAREQ